MEERIKKYWRGELSKEEISILLADLEHHKDALTEESRQVFESVANKETNTKTVSKRREHVLDAIHRRMEEEHVTKTKRIHFRKLSWIKVVAAVTTVFLCIGLLWNMYAPKHEDRTAQIFQSEVDIFKENTSERAIALRLPDQSLVILYPGSSIRWVVADMERQRVVHLTGKAQFDVFKDAERSFSVYNNGYSTTALGTSFIVDDNHGATSTAVVLLSGKVVVQAVETSAYDIGEVYLKPGDRLGVNIMERQFAVTRPSESREEQRPYTNGPTEHSASPFTTSLAFNREKLSEVFRAISVSSGIKVLFDEEDIAGFTFSGDLNKLKSTERMLQVVCDANQLQFKYENDQYIIITK